MTRAILICHGQLAFDFHSNLKKLYGEVPDILTFSNELLAPEVLYKNVVEKINENKNFSFIIMVDLKGGNCWKIGKMLTKEFPKIRLLSGVNVPMLVSFANKKESISFDELVEVLEKDAHRGIVLE
jgi:PTS system mannose-specific IIA component/fructoselysine and glucoselysine-specific PTS system IIA component